MKLKRVQPTILSILLAGTIAGSASAPAAFAHAAEPSIGCVVLLHGLLRGAGSMERLEKRLERADYRVININYASRDGVLDVLPKNAKPAPEAGPPSPQFDCE